MKTTSRHKVASAMLEDGMTGGSAPAKGAGTSRKTASGAKRKKAGGASNLPLHQQAYEQLKHLIITMAFRPGEYLNEAQVCKALKIGRTPIHQALNRLMLEGMVEVIPRKGVIVKAVSLNEVMEIIEVRLVNETHCARLAASRAEDGDIAAMEEVLVESQKAVEASDIERQMMLDRRFHSLLARAAKNDVLAGIMQNLHEQSLRFWFISLRDRAHHTDVQNEHRKILDAVEARDPDAAGDAVRRHIESFRKNVARFL
jgi:DNA-binding GntR family transcriptional regulator